jgi:hypothetical protein
MTGRYTRTRYAKFGKAQFTPVPLAPTLGAGLAGLAVVIPAEVLVARRRGGGDAECFGCARQRGHLIGFNFIVDLDALERLDHRFLQFIGADGFLSDLTQRNNRIFIAVAVNGKLCAARDFARALRRHKNQVKPVRNLVYTIFNGNARHEIGPPFLQECLELKTPVEASTRKVKEKHSALASLCRFAP